MGQTWISRRALRCGLAMAVALICATGAMGAQSLMYDTEYLSSIHTDFPPAFPSVLPEGQERPVWITVTGDVEGEVPAGLFGQLMERVRGDSEEAGAEVAWSTEANDWVEGFVPLVEQLAPTVIRYPGGMSAERTDWRWGIDRAPGRLTAADLGPGRGRMAQEIEPGVFTTFHIGTEEFVALCERVGAEPWLVVNAAGFRSCPAVGAALAADWVEYCNAPNDGSNPHGGVDWAAVRAANGHPEPHGVRLWEIGNEVWAWPTFIEPDEYQEIVRVYVAAMLEVDPHIEFIGMGNSGAWARASLEAFGPQLRHLTTVCYSLWRIDEENLTTNDIWRAMMSGPPNHFEESAAEALAAIAERGRSGEVRLAVSEWNVNTFFSHTPTPMLTIHLRMMGAAALLHHLMRRGDEVGLASMSVLVGSAWAITVIRIDDLAGGRPWPWPHHALMSLYSAQHGPQRLAIELTGCPPLGPSRRVGNIPARDSVPALDVVATRSAPAIFVHIINAAPADSISVVVDAAQADALPDTPVERHQIHHDDMLWLMPPEGAQLLTVTQVEAEDSELALTLPPHSVTVLVWPRGNDSGDQD